MYPQKDAKVLTRAVEKYTVNHFVKYDVCSYIVHSPDSQMLHNDKMVMRIDKIQEAKVAVQKTHCSNRRYHPHLWSDDVDDGTDFETAKGWCFLVIGYSKTIFKGSFRMRIWIESTDDYLVDPWKETKLKL